VDRGAPASRSPLRERDTRDDRARHRPLCLDRPRDADAALRAYDRARRKAFRGKWAIERLVALAVGVPALLERAAVTLEASPAMANLFVGVAGDFVPASEVLRPGYLARLVFGNLLRSRSSPLPLSP